MTDKTIPFSLLDLAPIPEGSSAREAFSHSLDLARLAEKRGYHASMGWICAESVAVLRTGLIGG